MVRRVGSAASLVAVLIPLLAAACGRPAEFGPAQQALVADSARELAARMAADVSARGYRGFPAAMDSAPGYLWAYNGFIPFAGYDAMARWARDPAEPHAPETFAWDSVRVLALAPGVAAVAGTYTETQTDSAGKPKTEKAVFTAVAVHRAEGWRFTNAHTSTLPPPAPVKGKR